MTLVKWHPLSGMRSPEREMEQFFGNFLNTAFDQKQSWTPRVDLSESEHGFEIVAEIPGMRKEDIQIKFQDNVLTLSGERVRVEEDGKQYHRLEGRYGKFERAFYMPDDVKSDEIKARYKEGVLTVEIPKSEKMKPKEISIH